MCEPQCNNLTKDDLQVILQQHYPLDKICSSEFIAVNRDGKAVYKIGYPVGRKIEYENLFVWTDNGRLVADY
jgi:hypothetical protein